MRIGSLLILVAALSGDGLPWRELSLTIEADRSTSSDHVTLCRVRVVNHGFHTWPGKSLRFEARALDGGIVVAREQGRFGLSLPPRGSLETIIGFVGRYDRFEVEPIRREEGKPAKRRRRTRHGSRLQ
jgi:hypothetical protein